ncbi:hypothetical protein QJS66_07895 [Kocuria rhizophila]|nr:hypothetical protein QJS66_07895 [Kocuria rhizophila]
MGLMISIPLLAIPHGAADRVARLPRWRSRHRPGRGGRGCARASPSGQVPTLVMTLRGQPARGLPHQPRRAGGHPARGVARGPDGQPGDRDGGLRGAPWRSRCPCSCTSANVPSPAV